MQNILTGLRVVEGSAFVAAPSGGMTLAQLGADVIRFDPIGGGIDYRRWPVTQNNESLYWHSLNKGKRSIQVDFRQAQGKEILTQLITAPGDDAGLFVTNFPAKGWLADEALRKHREDLIFLNLTGDRHGGSALDYTVNCKVGLPSLNQFASDLGENRPLNNPLPAWDVIAGQKIALGLLSAERHRRLTGEGQFIKLALADVALSTVGHLGYIAEETINKTSRQAMGNHIFGTFGRDFCCQDGHRVMIVGVSGNQWQSIVRCLGISGAVEQLALQMNLDFSLEGDRFRAQKQLAALMEPWFAQHVFSAVKQLLDNAGVCWGKYQSMHELVEEDIDCSTDNPIFDLVEQPGIGEYLMPGSPLHFGAVNREPVQAAPKLGQHTNEILMDTLGYSSAEVGRLHDKGIVAG